MSKKVAIAMTHGHTAKWLQTVICSLKSFFNVTEFDIYVACSWPGHPSIRALTETPLGDGVTLIDCKRRLHSHATGLEEILEHIWDKGYEYMFACETDCRAMKDGWLDWFVRFLDGKPSYGIAGFFWHEGTNHFNINPSATLYRMEMLKKYHEEARANNEDIFWHPKGNKLGTDGGMDPTIKDLVGCFAETRGIKNPSPEQLVYINGGIPFASWWEPGAWLFVRSIGEWSHIRVPVDHLYLHTPGQPSVYTPEGTYYGGKADPQFIHFWGGTRCYDWKKHPVNDNFVKNGTPWWIKREDTIWRETVPEEYRQIVHQLNMEANVEQKMRENLGIFVPEVM